MKDFLLTGADAGSVIVGSMDLSDGVVDLSPMMRIIEFAPTGLALHEMRSAKRARQ
jgi:hypothetical protein